MKHFFIVNPAAGKGTLQGNISDRVAEVCRSRGIDYEVYMTTAVADAERYVRATAANGEGGGKRFYLCGGDGTFNEGINGAVGFEGVACGVVPIGTGNDFSRNFTNRENFLDIAAQIDASELSIDLIRYNGTRYCVNMMNIGFDCQVVQYVADIKRNPLIGGKLAYISGVVKALVRMPGVDAKISADGSESYDYRLLLCCIGNGAYCGGGFKSAPYVSLDNGEMNLCAVRRVSRGKFVKLVGSYKEGTHVRPDTASVLDYVSCRTATLDFGTETAVCIDGEVEKHSALKLEVAPKALTLLVPKGCERIENPEIPSCAGRLKG